MAKYLNMQPVIYYSNATSATSMFSKNTFPQVLQIPLYSSRSQTLCFSAWNINRHESLEDPSQASLRVVNSKSFQQWLTHLMAFQSGWKECQINLSLFGILGSDKLRQNCQYTLPWVLASMLALGLWVTSPAYAADVLKTGTCLLKECRVELARCIADPACAANIACLQTCNNRLDETECQIGCGDLFENSVVDSFNKCAVSRNQCVPKKMDDGKFPIPPPSAVVDEFKVENFDGKWYISSGLNPTFDTFDCQLHEFSSSSNRLTGKLSWRIPTPDGGFITRSTVQNFVQDPKHPGILYNHDNEFLHYQDDWYILSARNKNKPDDYIFVYYRGRNDAWDGYGGAFVYTRSKTLPLSIVPELKDAAKKAGLDFNKFRATDNTCGPEPPLFARLEKKIEEGEAVLVKEIEEIEGKVENVGRTEKRLLQNLKEGAMELKKDEELFLRELGDEEKQLLQELKMGAEELEKLFGKPRPIRKLR